MNAPWSGEICIIEIPPSASVASISERCTSSGGELEWRHGVVLHRLRHDDRLRLRSLSHGRGPYVCAVFPSPGDDFSAQTLGTHDDPMAPRIPPLPKEGRDPKTAELLDGLQRLQRHRAQHLRHARPPPAAAEAVVRRSAACCSTAGRCRPASGSCSSCAPAICAGRPTSGASTWRSGWPPGSRDDEIARVAAGPDASGWSDADALPAPRRRRAPRRQPHRRRHVGARWPSGGTSSS